MFVLFLTQAPNLEPPLVTGWVACDRRSAPAGGPFLKLQERSAALPGYHWIHRFSSQEIDTILLHDLQMIYITKA